MDIGKVLFASIPLLWLLVSLTVIRLPTHSSGLVAFVLAAAIAFAIFGMKPLMIAEASLEGFFFALFPIVWVVVSAVFVYNIAVSTGSIESIKKTLTSMTEDRRIQALILAFGFGGFLESVAGFGTAVAIPAGIMLAMGFEPFQAATVCLIANTIPVAFGVLGVPVVTLSQVTGLSLVKLSLYTALQLTPFVVLLPFVLIASVTGNVRQIKGAIGISLASGIAFAVGQTLSAVFIGPELAAVVGSLLSLAVSILWVKARPVRQPWRFATEKTAIKQFKAKQKTSFSESLKAWSPYLCVLIIIFSVKYLPIQGILSHPPFTFSSQFYSGDGGHTQVFNIAASGGTALFLSAVLSGFIQGAKLKQICKTFLETLKQLWKTILTIVCVVMLAKIMGYSGMVSSIAAAIALLAGPVYPLIAPAVGALGTFLTGSDTSSNVLFGGLQKQTALQLHLNTDWLVAANASGATAGKMISPQSISIAISSTGLRGKESKILGKTIKYCIVYLVLIGALVMAGGAWIAAAG